MEKDDLSGDESRIVCESVFRRLIYANVVHGLLLAGAYWTLRVT